MNEWKIKVKKRSDREGKKEMNFYLLLEWLWICIWRTHIKLLILIIIIIFKQMDGF